MTRGPNNMQASFMEGLEEEQANTSELSWVERVSARFGQPGSGFSDPFCQWLIAGATRSGDTACTAFIADVEYRGGLNWLSVNAAAAHYRVLCADGSERSDMRYQDRLDATGGATIRELVEPLLTLELSLLASAVWASKSLAALQARIGELGAVVRYSSDLQGRVQGLLVPGPVLAARIGQIAAGNPADNRAAYDELPDLIGLRRQAMHLDQERLALAASLPAHGRFDPRRLLGLLRR